MKHKFRSALACALILAGIAGCGQKQNGAAPASQNTSSADQGTGAAPGAPHVDPSRSPIADPASPLYGWLKYDAPDHSFTIILPDVPKENDKTTQTPQGEIQVHAFASQDSNGQNGYSVATYDFPAIHGDAKMFLARLEQIIIKGQDAKVTSYKPVQVQNYPGTQFEFTAGGQANYSGTCRLVLAGQRAYAMMVVYLTAGPKPTDMDAFFGSLSILQK